MLWMYGSNSRTDLGAKVCETILRFRVCSARSRVLNRPRCFDATKAL